MRKWWRRNELRDIAGELCEKQRAAFAKKAEGKESMPPPYSKLSSSSRSLRISPV